MAESGNLAQRIKAEFESREQRLKARDQEKTRQSSERESRLARFGKTCDELKAVWGPRLQDFAKQLGDQIKVTPKIEPEQRQATVAFLTPLANITLSISVSANPEVTGLILDYDLLIIPSLFEYERHSRLEMPLDRIDEGAVAEWFDDRLIACVKSYLAMQDNEFYQQRAMVEDPITRAKFNRENAAAMLEHKGQKVYFASEDNMRQYRQKHQIA